MVSELTLLDIMGIMDLTNNAHMVFQFPWKL